MSTETSTVAKANPSLDVEDENWLKLSEGEKVIWAERPHPLTLFWPATLTILATVAGVYLTIFSLPMFDVMGIDLKWYPLLLPVLPLLAFLYRRKDRQKHYYVLTNKKFVERFGVFSRDTDPVHYNRISDAHSTETTFEHQLNRLIPGNIGTIKIWTASQEEPSVVKHAVPDVHEAEEIINQRMNDDSRSEPSETQY